MRINRQGLRNDDTSPAGCTNTKLDADLNLVKVERTLGKAVFCIEFARSNESSLVQSICS